MGKRRDMNLIDNTFSIVGIVISFAILILKIYIAIYVLAMMIALAPLIIFGSAFSFVVIAILKGL